MYLVSLSTLEGKRRNRWNVLTYGVQIDEEAEGIRENLEEVEDDGGDGGKALPSILRGADPLSRPSVYIPSSRIIAWLQQREWKIESGVAAIMSEKFDRSKDQTIVIPQEVRSSDR